MRKELWSKSEHGKCRISCSMCLFRFSSLSPDTLAITPSGGHCTWGGGGVWGGGGGRSSQPQHWSSCSVLFFCTGLRWLSRFPDLQTEMWTGKSLTFLTTQDEAYLPLHSSPWKTWKSVPQVGHWQVPIFKCRHLLSCVLHNSEIMLFTDVKEFRKAPTNTLVCFLVIQG